MRGKMKEIVENQRGANLTRVKRYPRKRCTRNYTEELEDNPRFMSTRLCAPSLR